MRQLRHVSAGAVVAALLLAILSSCTQGDGELLLGATTSVQDTDLLDVLVHEFEARYDFEVKPIVGGSGQILEQSRRGEMDVIMTHSPDEELGLIADGYGLDRTQVMQNYFVIVGPGDDPAGVADSSTMADVFERISGGEYEFISRGDNSGTHRREQSIWESAGINPIGESWYTESATGQGQNLLVANDNDGYTLVDSSTFIAFLDRLQIVELYRDQEKPNVYSVVRLNPERLDKVNSAGGDAWLEFMTGEGQRIVAQFGHEEFGEALFEPLPR